MLELVLPHQANIFGNILGGQVMHYMDMCAAMAAYRHCRRPVVTAEVDTVIFRNPIKIGQMMILRASVNYTHHTSMEIGVRVESEDPRTGDKAHTSTAYLTFVALDQYGKPMEIPPVIPETEKEKERFEKAKIRRAERLKKRKLGK
ncbi:acyl-CoA thioesterase [bacterium]|nr:acyl-CoA thioesterase [bacterium]